MAAASSRARGSLSPGRVGAGPLIAGTVMSAECTIWYSEPSGTSKVSEAAMGKRVTFSVSAWSSAPPGVVYDLLRDGATWPVWSPLGSFRLEREGRDGGESL